MLKHSKEDAIILVKRIKRIIKVEVKNDEEIANQEEENTDLFAMYLSSQDWWTICYHSYRLKF
jgi:hypothetical protein